MAHSITNVGMYASQCMYIYTDIFSSLHFTLLYSLALLQVLIIRAYFQKYNSSSYRVFDSAKFFEITALGFCFFKQYFKKSVTQSC